MSQPQELGSSEKYDLATGLVAQAPPGQVNDVIAGESRFE